MVDITVASICIAAHICTSGYNHGVVLYSILKNRSRGEGRLDKSASLSAVFFLQPCHGEFVPSTIVMLLKERVVRSGCHPVLYACSVFPVELGSSGSRAIGLVPAVALVIGLVW